MQYEIICDSFAVWDAMYALYFLNVCKLHDFSSGLYKIHICTQLLNVILYKVNIKENLLAFIFYI